MKNLNLFSIVSVSLLLNSSLLFALENQDELKSLVQNYSSKSDIELFKLEYANGVKALTTCFSSAVLTGSTAFANSIPLISVYTNVYAHSTYLPKADPSTPGFNRDYLDGIFSGAAIGILAFPVNVYRNIKHAIKNEEIQFEYLNGAYYATTNVYNVLLGKNSLCDKMLLKAEAARTIREFRGKNN